MKRSAAYILPVLLASVLVLIWGLTRLVDVRKEL